MKRVILTTGGTGGHVFPALAVAETLRTHGVECLFVGSEYGREGEWAREAGLEFVGLPVRGVLGRGFRAVGALFNMVRAVGMARKLVKNYKPDAVAGFGSYASCASLVAARTLGLPILVHEQNSYPGLTNRMMGRLAKTVCLSMDDASESGFQAEKCIWTGNPVRKSILAAAGSMHPEGAHAPHLLVLGGSLGARAVNSVVLGGLLRFMEAGIEIRHQTGRDDYERVEAGYKAHGLDSSGVMPFIDDMAEAYAWADLVLCRAGASTVAELAVCGKAAVFIPFPHATHDHQVHNARIVCREGAGMMFSEQEAVHKDVTGTLLMLLRDKDQLLIMGKAALTLARPDAAESVAAEIMKLA